MFKRTKPVPQRPVPAREEPTYIAKNTELDGNLLTDGEIHIDGLVRGTVQARTCLVDVDGEVHGGILAEIVFIRGRVFGPVSASQVTISGGAHVEGNVAHESISIEQGAYVLGNISHRNQQPPALVHDQSQKLQEMEAEPDQLDIWEKPEPASDGSQ